MESTSVLASVNVPMMYIGPMHVRVGYRLMHMVVVMFAFVFFFIVLMTMMFIMFVRMSMSKSFMLVNMPVYLEIEKEHSRKHKQRCHPIFHGWTLSKNDNGKDGADKWS
jgi:hypothetical protein